MSLTFRKSRRIGRRTRLNASKGGLSVSRRVGPVTVSSRGHWSVRLLRGLGWRP